MLDPVAHPILHALAPDRLDQRAAQSPVASADNGGSTAMRSGGPVDKPASASAIEERTAHVAHDLAFHTKGDSAGGGSIELHRRDEVLSGVAASVRVETTSADEVVVAAASRSVVEIDKWQASDEEEPPVGIQLVIAGTDADGFFGPFRDALIASETLLAEYNQLKRRLDGLEYERYTERKARFVERVLRELHGQRSE